MTQLDPNGNPQDLLSIDRAVDEFGVSRSTLFRLIADAKVSRYRRAGDRRSYVSRTEVSAVLEFRAVPPTK